MIQGVFRTLGISASALTAQRARLDAIVANLANRETTRTPEGGPYKAQHVVFRATSDGGVVVDRIIEDSNFLTVHDPTHPDADADGNVLLPNVDLVSEMTDMVGTQRSYQTQTQVISTTRSMFTRALSILSR